MYFPPLFTAVRPLFDPRDVQPQQNPVRENNPLDLSVKPPAHDHNPADAADDLLMLDHRKLASLAASHSLLGRQLVDPASLYRLGYGAEVLAAAPPPFCFDRATGVAVPTSLAGHQMMSSFLQQRERLEQQQAFFAARNQQAAVAAAAAAYMDPANLPLHLR